MEILTEDMFTINTVCRRWNNRDIVNLAVILELPEDEQTLRDIEDKFKWLFHSKLRARSKVAAKKIWGTFTRAKNNEKIEEQFETPTYQQLLSGLLKKLNVNCDDASLLEQEAFLCDAVIAEALVKMSPGQRRRAFTEQLQLDEITENIEDIDKTLAQTFRGAINGVGVI